MVGGDDSTSTSNLQETKVMISSNHCAFVELPCSFWAQNKQTFTLDLWAPQCDSFGKVQSRWWISGLCFCSWSSFVLVDLDLLGNTESSWRFAKIYMPVKGHKPVKICFPVKNEEIKVMTCYNWWDWFHIPFYAFWGLSIIYREQGRSLVMKTRLV